MSRVKITVLIVLAMLTTLSVTVVRASPMRWGIRIVDSCGTTHSVNTSIAADSNGNPHISYTDDINGNLMYARWTGTVWAIETVDSTGQVGQWPSIALDSYDNPHISYYEPWATGGTCDLKYARWTGTEWSFQIVSSAGNAGGRSSIAVDSNDDPHISYGHGWWTQNLMYAKWIGSGWSIETVDATGTIESISLALDSYDIPHISYVDYGTGYVKYAGPSDEYFSNVAYHSFDSDPDGYNDAVEVAVDVDTTCSGAITVYVDAYLLDMDDNVVSGDSASWSITGESVEWVFLHLYVPESSPEGWYDVMLYLYDEEGQFEDYRYDSDVAYLYPPGYGCTEYFYDVLYFPFDSDGDGYDDAVEVAMDVDTTYSGTLNVSVYTYLFNPDDNIVDSDSASWSITEEAVEWGFVYLYVTLDSPEGWYDVQLRLYDEWGNWEEIRYDSDAAYLYPPTTRPWDITGPTMWVPDGKCDMRDVALVAKLFGSLLGDGTYDSRADVTGPTYLIPDGKIDMRDVALVAKHFGEIY